jgi:hypothetical protein
MAGAYGGIPHLHDDRSLTFSEVKSIINQFKNGNQIIYEKFDGQNLLVTIKDGLVRCARNKNSLQHPYSLIQLQSKFASNKEHIKASFSEAMMAIENFLENVDATFFKNGSVFINCEIINPLTRNQIDYGNEKRIILTGAVMTDGLGNILSNLEVDSIDFLFHGSESIECLGWHLQKYTKLEYNVDDLVDTTILKLNEFLNINNLNGSHSLSNFLEHAIFKLIDRFQLTDSQKNSLKSRWVYGNKQLRLISANYGMSSKELSLYEKTQFEFDLIELLNDYTSIIQNFGNKLIQAISLNDSRMLNIQSLLMVYVSSLEFVKSNNFDVNKHLLSIKNMGGISNVRNIEGIVFYHNGSPYKMTGLFQPMNQICGYLKYKN